MMQLAMAAMLTFLAGGFCGNHDKVSERAVDWASYDAGIAGLQHVACVDTEVGIKPCRAFTAYTPPIVLLCTEDDCVHVGFTTDMSENWDVKNAKFTAATKRTRIVPQP